MGEVVLDADVAIGFLDPADAHHRRAVSTLRELDRSALVMPASAYSEILVRPLATGASGLVEEFVDGLGIDIAPLDRAVARIAAELREEHRSLRLPDAMVLATARRREARLISFDDRLSQLA